MWPAFRAHWAKRMSAPPPSWPPAPDRLLQTLSSAANWPARSQGWLQTVRRPCEAAVLVGVILLFLPPRAQPAAIHFVRLTSNNPG